MMTIAATEHPTPKSVGSYAGLTSSTSLSKEGSSTIRIQIYWFIQWFQERWTNKYRNLWSFVQAPQSSGLDAYHLPSWNVRYKCVFKNVKAMIIKSDCHSALRAVRACAFNSKLVVECLNALVPGHTDITKNEIKEKRFFFTFQSWGRIMWKNYKKLHLERVRFRTQSWDL
jgi:hypothetical protein